MDLFKEKEEVEVEAKKVDPVFGMEATITCKFKLEKDTQNKNFESNFKHVEKEKIFEESPLSLDIIDLKKIGAVAFLEEDEDNTYLDLEQMQSFIEEEK